MFGIQLKITSNAEKQENEIPQLEVKSISGITFRNDRYWTSQTRILKV